MIPAFLAMLILTGCGTTPQIEYVYVKPSCTVPVIEMPEGFSWDELTSRNVSVSTLKKIDDTVQSLVDQILVRQELIKSLCKE